MMRSLTSEGLRPTRKLPLGIEFSLMFRTFIVRREVRREDSLMSKAWSPAELLRRTFDHLVMFDTAKKSRRRLLRSWACKVSYRVSRETIPITLT
jgi:hypothetical protein